jgi:predicted transposase/invertase (TIGR01784 family)
MRQNKTRDLREVIMNLAPAYEQWYAKTKQEGKQEGRQEGRQEGITEGKQVQSIQTARRMLGRNMSLEEIAELTDLPLDRIQALQAENR